MCFRFDSGGDLFTRNTCLLSSSDVRDVNYDRNRDWDLYELLDSTFCRGRESVEGKKWLPMMITFQAACNRLFIDANYSTTFYQEDEIAHFRD